MQYKCMYCGEKINESRFLVQFPFSDENLLKSWYTNLGLDSHFPPHKRWKLCSDHFTKDSVKFSEKKLVSKSIPTLFNKRCWKYCICCGVHQYEVNCPSFHTFPDEDAVLLKMWLKSIRSSGIVPSLTSLVCSNHFEDNCFRNHERQKGYLKKSAVPTIFGQRSLLKDLYVESEKCPSESQIPLMSPLKSEMLDKFNDQQISAQEEIMITGDAPASIDYNDNIDNSLCRKENSTVKNISFDHNYATSPRKLKRKLLEEQEKNKKLKIAHRRDHEKINRMERKISSLKDICARSFLLKSTLNFHHDIVA